MSPTLFSQMVNVLHMSITQSLTSWTDKAHLITPYHSKCGIFIYVFFLVSLTYDIIYLSLSSTSPAIFIWCLVIFIFISRVYLTFVKAVTLILKHATLLRTSNPPEGALANVDLNYQKANIDEPIQQYLKACGSEQSVEQFASFIMGTNIGLFILLPFVTSISYCPLVSWSRQLFFLSLPSSIPFVTHDQWLGYLYHYWFNSVCYLHKKLHICHLFFWIMKHSISFIPLCPCLWVPPKLWQYTWYNLWLTACHEMMMLHLSATVSQRCLCTSPCCTNCM